MDQGKRPTIKDVAAEANVSVATVNRVLSGSGAVRQGMIRAVSTPNEGGNFTNILPFEIYTRENI